MRVNGPDQGFSNRQEKCQENVNKVDEGGDETEGKRKGTQNEGTEKREEDGTMVLLLCKSFQWISFSMARRKQMLSAVATCPQEGYDLREAGACHWLGKIFGHEGDFAGIV